MAVMPQMIRRTEVRRRAVLLLAAATVTRPASAQDVAAQRPVRIGVVLSLTGPASSIGIPERDSLALLPTEISGRRVEYLVLDEASDPTHAVANSRKLATEAEVDAVIGPSTSPGAIASVAAAAELQVPMVAVAGASRIVAPMDPQRRWAFKTPQNDGLMADAIAARMARDGVRTVGFIGFGDAFGDGWLREATRAFEAKGLRLVATERFARGDATVLSQALKLIAAQPDAVLVAGAGTPTVLPVRTLRERGYSGTLWQTHGAASAEYLKLGGAFVEGTMLPAGPVLVAAQLPDSNPVKAVALDFTRRYEAVHGAGSVSAFGAQAYDAGVLVLTAARQALGQGHQPGTPAFRAAVRDALEGTKDFAGTQGVFTMTLEDHNGLDERARVIVRVVDGAWRLVAD